MVGQARAEEEHCELAMFQWKVRLDGAGPEEGSRIAARAFQKQSQKCYTLSYTTRCQMTAPGTLDKARTPESGTGQWGASAGTQVAPG